MVREYHHQLRTHQALQVLEVPVETRSQAQPRLLERGLPEVRLNAGVPLPARLFVELPLRCEERLLVGQSEVVVERAKVARQLRLVEWQAEHRVQGKLGGNRAVLADDGGFERG